jgi:hypothetical protein
MTDEACGWEHLNHSKKRFLAVLSSLASLYTYSEPPRSLLYIHIASLLDRTFVVGGYISKFPSLGCVNIRKPI